MPEESHLSVVYQKLEQLCRAILVLHIGPHLPEPRNSPPTFPGDESKHTYTIHYINSRQYKL